jgi:predicted SprT family Zn-dependent metalloprotease
MGMRKVSLKNIPHESAVYRVPRHRMEFQTHALYACRAGRMRTEGRRVDEESEDTARKCGECDRAWIVSVVSEGTMS